VLFFKTLSTLLSKKPIFPTFFSTFNSFFAFPSTHFYFKNDPCSPLFFLWASSYLTFNISLGGFPCGLHADNFINSKALQDLPVCSGYVQLCSLDTQFCTFQLNFSLWFWSCNSAQTSCLGLWSTSTQAQASSVRNPASPLSSFTVAEKQLISITEGLTALN
jgi:hypothetical protein